MSISAQRRDRYRGIANRARRIPGQHGLRPYTIHAAIRSWSGTYVGDGTASESLTEITEASGQLPKVRWLNDEELALGNLGAATLEVGPITPSHSGGGTALSLLLGNSVDVGEVLHFVITGPEFPNGANFRKVAITTDRALHYKVRLQAVNETA